MKDQLAVIFCPPLSLYHEKPKDLSKCVLAYCPECKENMWLSLKKKKIKELWESLDKEIIFCCYTCFRKMVEKDPSLIINSHKVDI